MNKVRYSDGGLDIDVDSLVSCKQLDDCVGAVEAMFPFSICRGNGFADAGDFEEYEAGEFTRWRVLSGKVGLWGQYDDIGLGELNRWGFSNCEGW